MNLPEINLSELHDSIAAAFKAQFLDCCVDFYSRPGAKIVTPAIFFELEGVEPADPADTGTEQLEVELQFSAEVITAYNQSGLLGVRLLALGVASFVHGNRWGQPVTPGCLKSAGPEAFSGPIDAYESWCVSWTHTALLGKNIWEGGSTPEHILVSCVSHIGIPHEPDYVEINRLGFIG